MVNQRQLSNRSILPERRRKLRSMREPLQTNSLQADPRNHVAH